MRRYVVSSSLPAPPPRLVAVAGEEWRDEADSDRATDDGDGDGGSSEQRMHEAAQRLREVYYGQLVSECPQRDVLFHCALGLSLTCMAGDMELAVSILQQLLEAGYMRQQCRLQLAKCWQREGRIVRARQLLTDCLLEDPTDTDALEFQAEFDAAVKRDGKIALYGLIGMAAAIAIGWTAYRHGSGSSRPAAMQQFTTSAAVSRAM